MSSVTFMHAHILFYIDLSYSGLGFVRPKLVLDGTVDKTWFKPDKTGQNPREAINHSNGCETIEDDRGLINRMKICVKLLIKTLQNLRTFGQKIIGNNYPERKDYLSE